MIARRGGAALVALTAWAGLAIQLAASIAQTGSASSALIAMSRYFTVIANLLLAIGMSAIALGSRRIAQPFWAGGMTITILLVGVVYALLLRGLLSLSGGAALADLLLHRVTPIATAAWWLLAAPRGLRGSDPWRWTILPLAYFPYALLRGMIEGRYAYPFLDVASRGWSAVLSTGLAMAAAFLIGGWLLVWLDRRLQRR